MSHDFAKKGQAKNKPKRSPQKNARKRPEKKHIPGWVWFITGVLVTLFTQFLIHLASLDDQQDNKQDAAKDTAKEQKTSNKKAEKPKLKYRFYEELKQKQINVDTEKVAEREQEDYSYALQAGSFKNKQDAEQMRAEIILLGLDARIEARTSKKGTVWNRVIVGPFTSRSKLQEARSTLINNNVPTMVFKHD